MLVKKQLASLQSVVDCLLELSIQYQFDSVAGRYLSQFCLFYFVQVKKWYCCRVLCIS